MIIPKPRYWFDWTVPYFWGYPLNSFDSKMEYGHYVAWLQGHLAKLDVPLPENQRCLVNKVKSFDDARRLVISIAESLTYDRPQVEKCEEAARDRHMTAAEFRLQEEFEFEVLGEDELESLRTYVCADKDYDDDTDVTQEELKEAYCTPSEQYEQIRAEMIQKEASGCPDEILHYDIPYRAVFACLFRTVAKTPWQQMELLKVFYEEMNEGDGK